MKPPARASAPHGRKRSGRISRHQRCCLSMVWLMPAPKPKSKLRRSCRRAKAFSSEVDTGSREENASNKKLGLGSDSIRTGKALVRCFRSSLRFCCESLKRTSEPEPHYQSNTGVFFRIRSSLRQKPQSLRTSGTLEPDQSEIETAACGAEP